MPKQKPSTEEIREQAKAVIYDYIADANRKSDISKLRAFKEATTLYRSTIPKPTRICEEQKLTKPSLLEIAENRLAGEEKANLLELATFCQNLKMVPKWYAANHYHFKYKGQVIVYLNIGDGIADLSGLYEITLNGIESANMEKRLGELSEDMRAFYIENLMYCSACNPKHDHERSFVILGRKIDHVCRPWGLSFVNPAKTDMENIKKFVEYKISLINSAE